VGWGRYDKSMKKLSLVLAAALLVGCETFTGPQDKCYKKGDLVAYAVVGPIVRASGDTVPVQRIPMYAKMDFCVPAAELRR
jgi:hypothetical protein